MRWAAAIFCVEDVLAVSTLLIMENPGSSSSGSTTIPYSLYIENNAHLPYNLLVDRGVPRVQGECFSPSFCFFYVSSGGVK